MRTILVLLLATTGLWAQRNVTSPAGFGRILYPGGGPPATTRTGVGFNRNVFPLTPPTNPAQGVGFVAGPVVQPNGGRGQNVVVAPYPVYVNGNFGLNSNWNWGYGQQAVLEVPQQQVAPQQQPPVVIVNQYFGADQAPNRQVSQPPVVERVEPRLTETNQDREVIFMIAMKDHSIFAASAYWVEDNTLNYVTIQGDQNSVSLDLVDRDLSSRLNRDRKVAFGLPGR